MPSITTADEDDAVRLSVERQLQGSGHSDLRSVRCCVEDGVVVLYGTVPSYYAKQIAQMLVIKLGLALPVENRCEVEHSSHGNDSILRYPRGDE